MKVLQLFKRGVKIFSNWKCKLGDLEDCFQAKGHCSLSTVDKAPLHQNDGSSGEGQ